MDNVKYNYTNELEQSKKLKKDIEVLKYLKELLQQDEIPSDDKVINLYDLSIMVEKVQKMYNIQMKKTTKELKKCDKLCNRNEFDISIDLVEGKFTVFLLGKNEETWIKFKKNDRGIYFDEINLRNLRLSRLIKSLDEKYPNMFLDLYDIAKKSSHCLDVGLITRLIDNYLSINFTSLLGFVYINPKCPNNPVINNIINKNKNEILKRIAIEKSLLVDEYNELLDEYPKNKSRKKVKESNNGRTIPRKN